MNNKKFFINNAQEIIPSVNDSPYKRILAIGDVHASYDKLLVLWKKLSVTEDDLVIFLGDYLYGMGDSNIETLHWLIEHKKQNNIIFLRGNVDEIYLHTLFDLNGNFFTRLNSRIVSGIETASLKKSSFPNKIFDFLKNLLLSYQIRIGGRTYFFCHAGINIDEPLDKQTKRYLLDHPHLYDDFYQKYSGNAVIVVGHKSPKKILEELLELFSSQNLDLTKPIKVPNRTIVMLDTHAKEGGSLSCVDLLSGQLWQSKDNTSPASFDSVLFVCSGNSCRSPMAKYIMRYLLVKKGLSDKVSVDSAGCNARGGWGMSRGAREVLAKNHISFDKHISKPFTMQTVSLLFCDQ